jgi:serine protease Do
LKNKDTKSDHKKSEPEDWEWSLADEELKPIARKKSWLYVFVTILLIVGFLALSLPELQIIIASRFDFMADNQRLRSDQIVTTAKPAVVSIEASIWDGLSRSVRQGTGFNISPQGKIITNRHVVEGSNKIKVSFGDGRFFYVKSFIVVPGIDLVTIDLHSQNLPVIGVDKQDLPASGQQVTIIGNPLGLQKIAQRGKVGQYHLTKDNQVEVFDINVPANPGNSGSPVLNDYAQAVGIVFASSQMKIGAHTEVRALAIPINALP